MSQPAIYVLSCGLLLASGWIILRILVRRDYLRLGRLSPLTTFLQALLFFVYGGFPYIYLDKDWPAVHVGPPVHLAGMILLTVGLAFTLYGMFHLGVLRSMGRGAKRLERSGIYALSRNPQCLACALYVIGFAMLWPSWYAVGWAMLYFVLIHMMVLTEEEHLGQAHGQEYAAYCRQVPRYLGRPLVSRNAAG